MTPFREICLFKKKHVHICTKRFCSYTVIILQQVYLKVFTDILSISGYKVTGNLGEIIFKMCLDIFYFYGFDFSVLVKIGLWFHRVLLHVETASFL